MCNVYTFYAGLGVKHHKNLYHTIVQQNCSVVQLVTPRNLSGLANSFQLVDRQTQTVFSCSGWLSVDYALCFFQGKSILGGVDLKSWNEAHFIPNHILVLTYCAVILNCVLLFIQYLFLCFYRLENALNYGLERVWAVGYMKRSRRYGQALSISCIFPMVTLSIFFYQSY